MTCMTFGVMTFFLSEINSVIKPRWSLCELLCLKHIKIQFQMTRELMLTAVLCERNDVMVWSVQD